MQSPPSTTTAGRSGCTTTSAPTTSWWRACATWPAPTRCSTSALSTNYLTHFLPMPHICSPWSGGLCPPLTLRWTFSKTQKSIFMSRKVLDTCPPSPPQVDLFMSRDLDSAPTQREADAVQEWLRSGKTLHVMRDHPSHTFPMLGGSIQKQTKQNNQK